MPAAQVTLILNETYKLILLINEENSVYLSNECEGTCDCVEGCGGCLFDLMCIICAQNIQAFMKFQAHHYVYVEFHGSILLQTLTKKSTRDFLRYFSLYISIE